MHEARFVNITIIHKTIAGLELYEIEGGIPGGTKDYSFSADKYNRFTVPKSIPISTNDEVIIGRHKKVIKLIESWTTLNLIECE